MEFVRLTVSAVIFDNDGVLVDSHRETEQAWRQLAAEFNLDFDVLSSALVGRRAFDTLSAYLDGADLDRAIDRLEGLEIALAEHTQPIAGAIDLVAALAGHAWTIVTSASAPLAEARWRGAGITVPDRPVTADDVANGKPHPEPYLVGAQQLSVDPASCVVFEDSPAGGESARDAGATVVAVGDQPWPFEPAVRVADLASVQIDPAEDGAITLRLHAS